MQKRPNIVFVIADEFRRRALTEDPVIRPNFDKFISESLWMENAVSNYPVCSPYRAMLLSGLYPYAKNNGVTTNCNTDTSAFGVYLKGKTNCWSDILSDNGYDLGYIGKWHLDPPDPEHAVFTEGKRGNGVIWDSFTPKSRRHKFNFWHSYGCCDNHNNPHYYATNTPVEEPIRPNKWSAEHETDIAVGYIKNEDNVRDDSKPFVLVVSYNPPHMPFDMVPDKYKELYKDKTPDELLNSPAYAKEPLDGFYVNVGNACVDRARENVNNYFAAVTGIDEQFGRVLKAIEESGLDEDTIVVFTSDHGEMMGSHSLMYKNTWYSDSFIIPTVIRYKGKIKPAVNNSVINVVDWYPTILSLTGLKDKTPEDIHGDDMSEVILNGKELDGEGLFIQPFLGARGLKTQRYTFIVVKHYGGKEDWALFDDIEDPNQLKDIAKENNDVCKDLRAKLQKHLERAEDVWAQD